MDVDALLHILHRSLEDATPFVAFCYPGERELQVFQQDSEELITWKQGMESGFVFAPFSGDAPKVIIPPHSIYKVVLSEEGDKQKGSAAPVPQEDLLDRAKHISLVARALEELTSKTMEKVVLSRKISLERKQSHTLEVFMRLLYTYPDAFRYLWYHPQVGMWMGATPETLLQVNGSTLHTMSLAGTQPFNGTTEVSWGAKEQEEQAMVTRSILKSIDAYTVSSKAGTTTTVKAGRLLHLLTPITAQLREGRIPLDDIIAVLHPTPAVCGLPKERAREFILDHEGYDRGYYTGYLGPVDYRDETRLFVNLRCMEITPDHYHIYVGGGITADSNPEAEWEETVNKSKTMMAVL
ncbi:chorismate-binding protein [Robertkochia sediminum]|uniref:chorismate-binding protein n=1 Tax=Robertkochia sediminum TaxID=2785326 RepID=UPI0019328D86|nr:chorismate-binding protein [Robertkochia sediminum]MBL7473388.1 chorismate-binding protein [Robertkochia sediminum]